MKNTIHNGDCLELMMQIPDGSVDMILCDLPYGTTACKWDVIIPFESLWEQYKRIIKSNGAIVLTASQPFTTLLISSNLLLFKHTMVWNKKFAGAFALAKIRPMITHEDIVVFGKGRINYNPQMTTRLKSIKEGGKNKSDSAPVKYFEKMNKVYDKKHPISILDYPRELGRTIHPTQKPVALFEYLIKTYTNEGETVLDNCAGSGTTAIACLNTNRNYILMEKERNYFEMITNRIAKWHSEREPQGLFKTAI